MHSCTDKLYLLLVVIVIYVWPLIAAGIEWRLIGVLARIQHGCQQYSRYPRPQTYFGRGRGQCESRADQSDSSLEMNYSGPLPISIASICMQSSILPLALFPGLPGNASTRLLERTRCNNYRYCTVLCVTLGTVSGGIVIPNSLIPIQKKGLRKKKKNCIHTNTPSGHAITSDGSYTVQVHNTIIQFSDREYGGCQKQSYSRGRIQREYRYGRRGLQWWSRYPGQAERNRTSTSLEHRPHANVIGQILGNG